MAESNAIVNGFREGQEFYRFVATRVSTGYDEWTERSTGWRASIALHSFKAVRLTTKGAWIRPCIYSLSGGCQFDRLVLFASRKKYAYPTQEEAWKSFQIRQMRRVEILKDQLAYAKACKALSEATPPISKTAGQYPYEVEQ
jgi:hypothetical protein